MTVGLPEWDCHLSTHLLHLFFPALLQHTLPFYWPSRYLSPYSISSTSLVSVLLDATLWGLTGVLYPCFWSLSVASDATPRGATSSADLSKGHSCVTLIWRPLERGPGKYWHLLSSVSSWHLPVSSVCVCDCVIDLDSYVLCWLVVV